MIRFDIFLILSVLHFVSSKQASSSHSLRVGTNPVFKKGEEKAEVADSDVLCEEKDAKMFKGWKCKNLNA